MGAPVIPQPAAREFHLQILAGPEQGMAFRLLSARVTIGRDKDCDIALTNDPKCSRQHALIKYHNGQFIIELRSQQNSLVVDNESCEKAILNNGSTIQIGSTLLKFVVHSNAPTIAAVTPPQRPINLSNRKAKPSKRLYIYGGLALLVIWLVTSKSPSKKMAELRTEEQIETDIADIKKLEEAKAKQRQIPGQQGMIAEEAQAAYVRGFRDYRKGQFGSAVESFQACLALNPSHALCNRYLRLSQRRHNEVIQNFMLLGRKYRDQNQFVACQAAFRNVMSMVRDTSSKIYEEAKANYDVCKTATEGRF